METIFHTLLNHDVLCLLFNLTNYYIYCTSKKEINLYIFNSSFGSNNTYFYVINSPYNPHTVPLSGLSTTFS